MEKKKKNDNDDEANNKITPGNLQKGAGG